MLYRHSIAVYSFDAMHNLLFLKLGGFHLWFEYVGEPRSVWRLTCDVNDYELLIDGVCVCVLCARL